MKVIIGNGKVCNVIKIEGDVILPHSVIEVTDLNSIENQLSKFETGTVVINTASKINLEWCETNQKEAQEVNTIGAINVAKICQKFGFHLVHISSGCIFDGGESEKEYTEYDTPTPAAWYTKTKTMADQGILDLDYEKVTIVRPRQLISSIKNPTNMLTKFLSLEKGNFIDSRNSLTCIEDMGLMINHLIDGKHYGVFNLANEGTISPYEIALELKTNLHPEFIVNKISYDDYLKSLKVKRVNTILNIDKLKSTGFVPRTAKSALDWCIKNYKD
jgi:dTDP-4-dehydrorhamnose reductase